MREKERGMCDRHITSSSFSVSVCCMHRMGGMKRRVRTSDGREKMMPDALIRRQIRMYHSCFMARILSLPLSDPPAFLPS